MVMEGKTHKLGDDINTDYIIAGRYKFKTLDMNELATHLFEDIDPAFYSKVQKGDVIAAGENFGCGSSREQAPVVIKCAGISVIIAKSFARIFFRNGINLGLILLEADTDMISDGDILSIDTGNGLITNKTTGVEINSKPLPSFITEIVKEGGVVNYLKKFGEFKI